MRAAGGKQITGCRLGYRTWGKLNADRSNAILFPSWFSGGSKDIAGYVGADKILDPTTYFVIAVDALGDGVSSPSNSTTQHGPAFLPSPRATWLAPNTGWSQRPSA